VAWLLAVKADSTLGSGVIVPVCDSDTSSSAHATSVRQAHALIGRSWPDRSHVNVVVETVDTACAVGPSTPLALDVVPVVDRACLGSLALSRFSQRLRDLCSRRSLSLHHLDVLLGPVVLLEPVDESLDGLVVAVMEPEAFGLDL
jgi:hypothetical protein